ncbi:MAG TPA: acetylxylan esterase [Draconibacterium sp.]|nr:acetylxylan esterase [Draconibacterium sp.]
MNTKGKHSILLTLFFLLAQVAIAQQVSLIQSNPGGIYNKGEKIEVVLQTHDLSVDSILIKTDRNYANAAPWETIENPRGELVLFNGSYKEPTAIVVSVKVGDKITSTGLVVAPENFKPATKRPKDFDKFWKAEKKALRKLPMELHRTPVEEADPGFVCYDMEINCTGPKPAWGYFAKPVNAKKGTLPIVLYVHAAGVNGDWCLSKPETALEYAKKGNGVLAFDLNAHGMLNGQPQKYYDDLQNGELRNYWEFGAENREENYFRGMYLRLLRTLDFLCSQPEWDGKRILVIGESQGGGQALAAAGLDHRVTAAIATVPAMCDFGRKLRGETGGWPNPFTFQKDEKKMLATYPYFDDAHLLKGSKAKLITEIGLIDYTCPSSGIFAAINQNKGKKVTMVTTYRGHHLDQKEFQEDWEERIYKTKMQFIENYLK